MYCSIVWSWQRLQNSQVTGNIKLFSFQGSICPPPLKW
nr:MAG TPA: hypothetical protein [Caudoviricetes sp.]